MKISKKTRRHRQRVKGAKKAKENKRKNKVNRDKQLMLLRQQREIAFFRVVFAKPAKAETPVVPLPKKGKKKPTLPGLPVGAKEAA